MRTIIASEHFSLTPAIKGHVEGQLARLEAMLPANASLRVFLSKAGRKTFTALFRVHFRGRDLVAQDEGDDLYDAVSRAALHMKRMLASLEGKRVQKRREHHGAA